MSPSLVSTGALLAILFGPPVTERWRPPELTVKEGTPAARFDEVRDLALEYLGRPYVMGGVGSPGFDCSGFVCRIYAEAGYALPRVSRDQVSAGSAIELSSIEAGDLLFFVSEPGATRIAHVGMYLGDGELIHASTGEGRVVVADLDASWFKERLVAARRILRAPSMTETSSVGGAPASTRSSGEARTLELVEHTGDSLLPPMLRRPPRRPEPSFGPELAGSGRTSIGARSCLITEGGVLGWTLVPEATLRIESLALSVAVAAPIRFERRERVTVGELESFGDWTRFLRSVSFGLRGADVDLRLSRLGDVTLLGGVIVDRVSPASESSGVPGLTVARSALSFFGGVRGEDVGVEALIDDVIDPALVGIGLHVASGLDDLELGVAFATDQRGELLGQRRALSALEVDARMRWVETREWSFDLSAIGAGTRVLSTSGASGELRASVQHRFGASGASDATVDLGAGYLGRRILHGVFGPTYLVARSSHLEAVEDASGRAFALVRARVTFGRFTLGLTFEDGLGRGRGTFDQSLSSLLEVADLPIGGTRILDLRAVYAARSPFHSEGREHVFHGGARLRLASWIHGELYAEKGEGAFQGGIGATLSWTP